MEVKPGAAGVPRIAVNSEASVPLLSQIRDEVAWLIATRRLQPGDRLPSIRALATATGVHHHTVRAAYRQLELDGLIEVRHGVAARVRAFSSRHLARPRIARARGTIGVLVAGYDPFYLPFLAGVEAAAAASGTLTTVCVTEDNPVKGRIQLDRLVATGVLGIIAASVGALVEVELAGESGPIPIVYCDQPDMARHSIVFDARAAGREVGTHLAAHGHRRITFVTPWPDWPNMAALGAGLRRAAGEAGLVDLEIYEASDFTLVAGVDAGNRLVARGNPPSAVVASSDMLAIGLLRAARDRGVRVPEDLAVVGYGALDVSDLIEPPLATVALPALEMGRLAMERLTSLVHRRPTPADTTVLPTRFLPRRSCGCG